MNEVLITIGLTCYNAEDTIVRALKSAMDQDWPHKEIVVVDDGSSDQSRQVLRAFLQDYPEVLYVEHKKNIGAAGARNTIVREAKGDYVTFFDDDDESFPERLSVQYERICGYKGSDVVLCFSSGTREYANGYVMDLAAIGCDDDRVPYGDSFVSRYLFMGGDDTFDYGAGTPTCSLMASRSVFKAVGKYDESLRRVEDLDFAIRAAFIGAHFIGCKQKLFIQHSTDAQDKTPEKNLDAELIIVEKHRDFLKKNGRYHYARTWPQIRCFHFQGKRISMGLMLARLFMRHPLWVTGHVLNTGLKRIQHENKIH